MAAPIELKKINEFVSGLTALTNIAGSFVYGIDSNGNSIKISTALFAAQVTTQQFNEVVTKCNNNGTLIAALQIAVNGKADEIHTHSISDVEGLQDALDGKSDTGHKHAISDVNGLESRLSDIENTTAEIDGYGRRITAAETNIRQNSVDLQSQNTRVTALETATNGYSSAIQTNTSNIATLTTTVNGMSNLISGKADQADLDNVENQISSLSTTVGEKAAQTEMDALDLRVVNLENGTTGGAMVQADLSQMENPTVNMIAQHTGTTSGNLVNGYIYKYKSNGEELVVNVTARKTDYYSDENIPVGAYRFTGVTTETSVDIADGNGASTQTVYQLQDENDNLYWCLDSSKTIVGKRKTGIKIDHTADSGTPTAGVALWITDVPVYLTTTETYSWVQTDVQPSITISYDSTAKKILVKNAQNVVLSEIDCTDFIKDGMVSNAVYNSTTHKLTISFNTDSGNQPIEVDLSDLVDVADGSNVELSENYEKASTYTEPAAGDSVDEAIGKLAKGVQDATSNTSESIKILQDLAKKVGVSKNMSVVVYKGGSLFSHNEGYYNRNIAEAVISATGAVITINTSYDTTGAAGNQKICIVKELNSENYHFLPNDSTKIGTQYTLVYDYDEYAQLADLIGSQDDALPSGTIVLWSGSMNNIPDGWALCNGQNGTPNLSGKFVIGASNSYQPDATGGATSRSITLTTANMPKHRHTGSTNSSSNSSGTISKTIYQPKNRTGYPNGSADSGDGSNTGNAQQAYWRGYSDTTIAVNSFAPHRHDFTTDETGSGTAFTVSTMPPYYALCYIIKL